MTTEERCIGVIWHRHEGQWTSRYETAYCWRCVSLGVIDMSVALWGCGHIGSKYPLGEADFRLKRSCGHCVPPGAS